MIISAPKNLNTSSIPAFLIGCERVFEAKNKSAKDFIFDLTKVQKSSLLGVLIIYKIVEYSVVNACFENPHLKMEVDSVIGRDLEQYGFTDLVLGHIRDGKSRRKEYDKLKIKLENNFIIAPHALIRADRKSKDEINKTYLPQIEKYYSGRDKTISMILLVFSEVLLNFWEHAKEDTQSIIVAYGNPKRIEIACADTGDGIVTSLGTTLVNSDKLKPNTILLKSLEKGITSKKNSNHMGYGLWILNQLATLTKGRIALFSQGAYYINEAGATTSGECGFWKGTIISIALPLENPKTLEDIHDERDGNIKINWA